MEVLHIIFQSFFLIVLNIYPNSVRKKFSNSFFISLAKSCVLLSTVLLFYSFLNIDLKYLVSFLYVIFSINLIFFIIDCKTNSSIFYKTIFFTLILFIFSINLASDLKIGWDAQNIWFPKALNFIDGEKIDNLKNLPRPDYPFFGPYMWAIFSDVSFLKHEYFGRIFYIYVFCLSIFAIIEKINLKNELKFLLSLIILVMLSSKNLFNGYQEVLIFAYAIFLSIIAIDLIEKKKKFNYLSLLSCSFILFWIKNEAFILTLSFLFILTFYLNFNFKKKVFYILSIIFLIYLKYTLFNLFDLNFNLQQGNYELLKLNTITEKFSLDRALEIIFYLIVGFVKNPFGFVILISSVPFLIKLEKKKVVTFFILNFYLSLFILFAAYCLTSFPLTFHLKTSVDRLVFEVMGFGFVIFVYFANSLIKKN